MAENDKLSILKMIETGRITADEGLRLLEALEAPQREGQPRPGRHGREDLPEPKRVRIQVSELGTGRRRIDANLPMPLVDLALRLATRSARSINVAGRPIDPDEIWRAAHEGARGRVLNLEDDDENVKVEVFVE